MIYALKHFFYISYTHVCVHIYTHRHTHTQNTHTYAYIVPFLFSPFNSYLSTNFIEHMGAHADTYTHTHTHTHTHIHIHTYTYTHTHTHTHTHIYIYTYYIHTLFPSCSLFSILSSFQSGNSYHSTNFTIHLRIQVLAFPTATCHRLCPTSANSHQPLLLA